MRVIGVNTLFIMWGFLLLSSAKTSSCWSPERRGIYKEIDIHTDILTQWSLTVVVNPLNYLSAAELGHIIGNHLFHWFFFVSCNSLTSFFFLNGIFLFIFISKIQSCTLVYAILFVLIYNYRTCIMMIFTRFFKHLTLKTVNTSYRKVMMINQSLELVNTFF